METIPLTDQEVADDCIVLSIRNVALSDEQFDELCADNPELVFEITAQKELVIMTPPRTKTGRRNLRINYRLEQWSEIDGRGIAFDANTMFELPNGAKRAPDGSWVLLKRWSALTPE